ncbi:MAG: hypothetical protein LBH19_15955 [Dysgonamonadaceae bacterium]|jgi:hypothetical protein|nr:hypothetical protein [Dysgonamonadaceae bacterium]
MEEQELIRLWKEQDAKIERTLQINSRLLREMTDHKAKKALNALIWFKSWGIVSFVFYLALLGFALVIALIAAIGRHTSAGIYFIVSTAAIMLVNVKGLSDYIRHLIMAHSIDYNSSVVAIQQQLAKIRISILYHLRTMFLQIPFYTTIYLSDLWFPAKVSWVYMAFQVVFTGLSAGLAVWFYKNHKPENLHKKWLRSLVRDSGGKYIEKAMAFYDELETFKQE